MAKDIADFDRELKKLCGKHDVFLKSVSQNRERPNGPRFLDYHILAKLDKEEGEIDLIETEKFS